MVCRWFTWVLLSLKPLVSVASLKMVEFCAHVPHVIGLMLFQLPNLRFMPVNNRRSSQYICFENGNSLLDVLKISRNAPLNALEATILNAVDSASKEKCFTRKKCKGGYEFQQESLDFCIEFCW